MARCDRVDEGIQAIEIVIVVCGSVYKDSYLSYNFSVMHYPYSIPASNEDLVTRSLKMVRQIFLLAALIALVSCNSGSSSSPVSSAAKYPVSVSMASYTTAGLFMRNLLISDAHAVVSDLRLCFKRMRFKKSITDIDDPLIDENIDLQLGEVSISGAGTILATVSVPADTYYRIEFDLDPSCAANSVYLTNDFGSFTSSEGLKIKFDGAFVVNGSETLNLGVQDVLNAANAYNGVGSLKNALEAVSGNL